MRVEKVAILNEVVDRVKASEYCFILNYGGVSVDKVAKLRAALKTHDSRLLVVKNTFLAKAAKEKGWSDDVQKMLTGPTAIVTGSGEVTAVAKDVVDFVEASEGRASVKGADYDGKIVDAAMVEALSKVPGKEVEALSKVPGKDQLRATLLMLLKEPATRLARVLSEKAKKEGGEAPAA